MISILDKAEQSERSSDVDSAKSELQDFMNIWNSHRHMLATFIRHSEIDIANQSAAKLPELAVSDDRSQFYAECEVLKMQLNHIEDSEKFSIDNIL
jgi:thiamine biosynthesis lipoprotein ApbE